MPDKSPKHFADATVDPGREPPLHYEGIGLPDEEEVYLPPGTLAPGNELEETATADLLREEKSVVDTISSLCGGRDRFRLDDYGRISYEARPKGDVITEQNVRAIDELVDRLVLIKAALKSRHGKK